MYILNLNPQNRRNGEHIRYSSEFFPREISSFSERPRSSYASAQIVKILDFHICPILPFIRYQCSARTTEANQCSAIL